MSNHKLAMLHIKKQYERNYPLNQLPRSANQIFLYRLGWKTKIYSNGEYASKDLRTLHLKEDSTKPLFASQLSFPTNPLRWCSKLKCSTPIVTHKLCSLPHRRGMHIDFTPPSGRSSQPSIEIIRKMESSAHN